MPITKLSPTEITTELQKVPRWSLVSGKLHRELKFPSFVHAFGFMTQVAILAEKQDHHPEWSNVYGTVVIDLTTHDCDGLSTHDFVLAAAIDKLGAP